jgi:hypothetical protein
LRLSFSIASSSRCKPLAPLGLLKRGKPKRVPRDYKSAHRALAQVAVERAAGRRRRTKAPR